MHAPATALTVAVSLLATSAAIAAPPAAPQLTVGADIKQLIFDWDDVAGAAYYRLLVQINSDPYKPLIDNIPASTSQVKLNVAVHLQHWSTRRYAVAACNTSGCTNSAAVFPQDLMLDTIGYLKASNTGPGDKFGRTLVMSDDGRTLAVTAPGESSNAAGVNGNQADNSSKGSGAVYVYRRVSTGWRQEAYLKAAANQPQQLFGTTKFIEADGVLSFLDPESALAINADGTLLAIGAPGHNTGGIQDAGVVYIYQKSSSGSWSLATTLHSPAPQPFDDFGASVDMSLDGRTIKVNSLTPYVAGKPEVRTHIFVRPGTTWQHSVTLAPFFPGDACRIVRLSRDGNTLVSSCENSSAGRLETRKRSGDTWTHVSDQPLNFQASNIGLALDFDANTLALQRPSESPAGTVALYQWTGSDWALQTRIRTPNVTTRVGTFGRALAFSRTGDLLAIGNVYAYEDGAGVSPGSMPGGQIRGAVYVWQRTAGNPATWTRRSVVKSPNPGLKDFFGRSVAMCGNGSALAIGAEGEDSLAKGIDGDRTDNTSTDSGAAYLY